MATLVIGVGSTYTTDQLLEMKKVAQSMLPEGTQVLIIGNCTALAVVEG